MATVLTVTSFRDAEDECKEDATLVIDRNAHRGIELSQADVFPVSATRANVKGSIGWKLHEPVLVSAKAPKRLFEWFLTIAQ